MTPFDSLSPEEFATLAYIVGVALASDNDVSENAVIGSFFSLISSVIITFAAQQQSVNDNSNNNDNNTDNNSIKDLEERVKKLEEKLK